MGIYTNKMPKNSHLTYAMKCVIFIGQICSIWNLFNNNFVFVLGPYILWPQTQISRAVTITLVVAIVCAQ